MPSTSPAQPRFASDLIPLLAWICGITVALLIRYGYYGSCSLVVGPNSSRLLHASSLFVEEVHIQGHDGEGLLIYGFSEPPELSLETNWSSLNHLSIGPYGQEGFSLWLNEGSRIWMQWEVTYSSGSYEDMYVVVTKGEQTLKESPLHMFHRRSSRRPPARSVLALSSDGAKEANYEIDEDDSYYIGIINVNAHRMETTLKINVSSKAYDTKGATSECSTTSSSNGGLCKLNLPFPTIQYFLLKTDDNVPVETMNVQLSFAARSAAYFLVVGCVVLVVYLVLHQLGDCESDINEDVSTMEPETETETETTVLTKGTAFTYNTNEEDPTTIVCSSTDNMYEKICAICYDDLRNCFFTPCGHSIACRTCAKRIMEEENKVCPICRRLIHRVKTLVSAPKESWINQEKESTSKEPSVQEKDLTS